MMNNNNNDYTRDQLEAEQDENDDFPNQPRIPGMNQQQREDYCYRAYRMIGRLQRQLRRQPTGARQTERLNRENIRLQGQLEDAEYVAEKAHAELRQVRGENEGLRRRIEEGQEELTRARQATNDVSAAFRDNNAAANRVTMALHARLQTVTQDLTRAREEVRRLEALVQQLTPPVIDPSALQNAPEEAGRVAATVEVKEEVPEATPAPASSSSSNNNNNAQLEIEYIVLDGEDDDLSSRAEK